MKYSLFTISVIFLFIGNLIFAQHDIDGARPSGSSNDGVNLGKSGVTNIQFTHHSHSGSHGLLFNAYKPSSTVSGSLKASGNTKFVNNEGSYKNGAGAIMFFGNYGTMDFLISDKSTGANTDIEWGEPKLRIKRDGTVGIGTSSPSMKLDVYNSEIEESFKLTTGTDGRVLTMRGETINFKRAGSNYIAASSLTGALNFSTGGSDIYNGQIRMKITPSGNVGIGTTSPNHELEVNGITLASNFRTTTSSSYNHFIRNGTGAAVYINQVSNNHPILRLSSGTSEPNEQVRFTVENDGSVGIGTSSPIHKLDVNGTIRSKEVKVEANNWPDYVFEEDYNLRSLEETESYIQSNKHLPEIPSAKEMEANGVQLGEMNMLLLKKIEELTLHAIAQEKKLSSQDLKIDNCELTIDNLSQQLKANSQSQNEREAKQGELEKRIEELTLHTIEQQKLIKTQRSIIEELIKGIEKIEAN